MQLFSLSVPLDFAEKALGENYPAAGFDYPALGFFQLPDSFPRSKAREREQAAKIHGLLPFLRQR
ncbi:MAG: hypothetical protein PUD40_02770 [Bacteroidales bacterium]|nr:hypothetical protein [Bacteroidales bacterium]